MASPREDEFFLPDFCTARSVLTVVAASQIVVFLLILARPGGPEPWMDLLRMTLFVQWIALVNTAALCLARGRLASMPLYRASGIAFVLLVSVAAALAELAWRTVHWLGLGVELLPPEHAGFLLRTVGLAAIVSAVVLRYLYVQHQWRARVKAEAGSRLTALQARIRPHFLFNSMNTIAALTRSDAESAETAVEDLADLFRASLAENSQWITLDEELELCRRYLRIEAQRLGQRLRVRWDVDALPGSARIPGLTLQPLLENAIYHGIEPQTGGGEVVVTGTTDGATVRIEITNPVPSGGARSREGHRLALDNVAERLQLSFDGGARLDTDTTAGRFTARISFPREDEGETAGRG